ncbi:MAG: hypothetical protein L3J67_13530 [Hyphomicrobiaceae bacterium]|nr:hypothetical protein [Hyphomicrobiaceae bacterium]
MSFDITKELQKTFDKAVMSHEAPSLKTPKDWQELTKIRDAATDRISAATQKHFDEYDSRVETVRKRLIDEAAEQKFEYPKPAGRNKFNGTTIISQAHREVQGDHERMIMQIRDDETIALANLQDEAAQRNLPHGKAKEHFNQARDQRSGTDRRAPSRHR